MPPLAALVQLDCPLVVYFRFWAASMAAAYYFFEHLDLAELRSHSRMSHLRGPESLRDTKGAVVVSMKQPADYRGAARATQAAYCHGHIVKGDDGLMTGIVLQYKTRQGDS